MSTAPLRAHGSAPCGRHARARCKPLPFFCVCSVADYAVARMRWRGCALGPRVWVACGVVAVWGFQYVDCVSIRAAIRQAFAAWASNHPAISFHDVTADCADAGDTFGGPLGVGCSRAEIWLTTKNASAIAAEGAGEHVAATTLNDVSVWEHSMYHPNGLRTLISRDRTHGPLPHTQYPLSHTYARTMLGPPIAVALRHTPSHTPRHAPPHALPPQASTLEPTPRGAHSSLSAPAISPAAMASAGISTRRSATDSTDGSAAWAQRVSS